ncbi:MAG: rhomboid family intramembrane serine protease [Lentisphaeria bacterium]|nr:rhomboid family intramembrane serine protease [Lentisphaeria bacterium]
MSFFNDNSSNAGFSARKVLFGIICVSVLCFILIMTPRAPLGELFCMTPAAVKDFQLWRLFSSLFICTSGWDLFFQMFALYIFGNILSPRISGSHLLCLYLVSGLAGNLLWLAFSRNLPGVIYGPGGAVNGVIMASAMALPEIQMYLLFIPFPVKLRTMAIVFMLLNVLLSGFSPFSLLDIGGFLGGYLYMRFFLKKIVQWDMLDSVKIRQSSSPQQKAYSFRTAPGTQKNQVYPDRNEVDRILDKLSRDGINSLTDEEIRVLEKVREQMNRKN